MAGAAGLAYAGAIRPAMEFESAFAGVKKTVEATPEQLLAIQNGIREMATEIPMGTTEIAALAEAAGQLGIQTDNILSFSRVMADLGVATNLTGEEAASSLARFANITGMSQGDFDRLGSTIVALGNNLATTEADIVAMAMRLAGAGSQVGLTEAEILAFAGALSSVGIEAEAGGSAFSKVMVQMQLAAETGGEKLRSFARVAGVSAKDFKKAFKEDAAAAMQLFINGLGDTKRLGASAIKVLDDMDIKEVRMRDALLRAAGAQDIFAESVALGTRTWEENNALANEAQQRYATTESALAMMKNAFNDISITLGDMLLPKFAELVRQASGAAKKIKVFVEENKETIATVAKVAAGLLAAKAAFLSVKLVILQAKGAFLAAKSAMLVLNMAMAANPIGAVVLAVAALIAVFAYLYKNFDSFGEFVGGIKEKVGVFAEKARDIIDNLIAKLPELFEAFKNIMGSVIEAVSEALPELLDAGKGILTSIIDGISEILPQLTEIAIGLTGTIARAIVERLPQVIDAGMRILDSILEGIKTTVPKLLSAAAGLVASLIGRIAENMPAIIDVGIQVLDSVISGIATAIPKLLETALVLISSFLRTVAENLPQIIDAGVGMLKSLLDGIIQYLPTLLSRVVGLIADVVRLFIEHGPDLVGIGVEIIKSIISGITQAIPLLLGALPKVLDAITGAFGELGGKLSDIVSGAGQAIKGVFASGGETSDGATKGTARRKGTATPHFEKGSSYTPDTFIAGDVGGKGGELVTNARGYQVFTAAQTNEILGNINRARAINSALPPVSNSDTGRMPTPQARGGGFVIEYSPTIYVNGDKPGDLEEKLRANNESLLRMFEEFLRKQRDNERRMSYA
jgi:TP901 family phage tail tape measure protein